MTRSVSPTPGTSAPTPGTSKLESAKHKRAVREDDIMRVRDQLTDCERTKVDNAEISRYLRATSNDVKHVRVDIQARTTPHNSARKPFKMTIEFKLALCDLQALKRIRDTLAWRAKEQPDKMVCTACQKLPKSHYMQVIGHDKTNRPVIYSCLDLAANRDVEDNRQHMISTFEQARFLSLRLLSCVVPS